MGKPQDQLKYMGDDPGTCPVCHCNAMLVGRESMVECAICGIKGELKQKGGKISVTFSKEQQAISRLTLEGKRLHFYEIADVQMGFDSRKHELPARLERSTRATSLHGSSEWGDGTDSGLDHPRLPSPIEGISAESTAEGLPWFVPALKQPYGHSGIRDQRSRPLRGENKVCLPREAA